MEGFPARSAANCAARRILDPSINIYHRHPENPDCTRAYMLVAAGEHARAKEILEAIGYRDADAQIEMIEGFVRFQADCNRKSFRRRKGAQTVANRTMAVSTMLSSFGNFRRPEDPKMTQAGMLIKKAKHPRPKM